ncbi:unnamed protein product, partial [Cuscuta campestris]
STLRVNAGGLWFVW